VTIRRETIEWADAYYIELWINFGDADLYISISDIPTKLNYDFSSAKGGTNDEYIGLFLDPFKEGNQDLTIYFSAYGHYASEIIVLTYPFKTFKYPYNDKVFDSRVEMGNIIYFSLTLMKTY
jgi:hypothetical protein